MPGEKRITIQEALIQCTGLPTHEGLVADIFHEDNAPTAISRAKRNALNQPKNIAEWTKKIEDTRDLRLMLVADGRFQVLSIPRAEFIDRALGYAEIEWIDGVNLGLPTEKTSTYDSFGFDSKIRGIIEYLRLISLLNHKGKVYADHKSTAIIAKDNYRKVTRSDVDDVYKYHMVDVSIITPQLERKEETTTNLMWSIEIGQTERLVKGSRLSETLRSFVIPDLEKLTSLSHGEIYSLLLPIKLKQIIGELGGFQDADQLCTAIESWQLGLGEYQIISKPDIEYYRDAYRKLSGLDTLTSRYSTDLEELSTLIYYAKTNGVSDYTLASKVALLAGSHFLELQRFPKK